MNNEVNSNKKVRKICAGHYEYLGFHVSAHYGSSETIWNIFTDKNLTDEYAIGFHTKSNAIEFIENNN